MPDPVPDPIAAAAEPRPPENADPTPAEAGPLDFSGPLDLAPAEPASDGDAPPVTAEASAAGVAEDGAEGLAEALASTLAAKLLPTSFAARAFLCPDAARAGRFALETIRAFQQGAGRPKRARLLYCAGPGAAPPPPGIADDAGIDILATDDLGALLGAITPKTAGILIAPVRAAPTLEVLPGGLLAGLREAADEYGIALVFDETVSGLCRSGMMWAHEWTGVTPDVMIVGAGLAGPAPLSAVLTTQKVARGAGRPAPVDAAALAAAHDHLDRLVAPGFDGAVQSRAWALEDRLTLLAYRHRAVFTGVVGLGLLQGLVCAGEAAPLAEKAAAEGLLTRPMGQVLGLFPALTVSEAEIDAAAAILARIAA